MAVYEYRCHAHGIFEIFQGMHERHEATCPQCGAAMNRVFTPPAVKCGNAKLGNNRVELFDNLASEGFANKEWREHDTYYKQAVGIED